MPQFIPAPVTLRCQDLESTRSPILLQDWMARWSHAEKGDPVAISVSFSSDRPLPAYSGTELLYLTSTSSPAIVNQPVGWFDRAQLEKYSPGIMTFLSRLSPSLQQAVREMAGDDTVPRNLSLIVCRGFALLISNERDIYDSYVQAEGDITPEAIKRFLSLMVLTPPQSAHEVLAMGHDAKLLLDYASERYLRKVHGGEDILLSASAFLKTNFADPLPE